MYEATYIPKTGREHDPADRDVVGKCGEECGTPEIPRRASHPRWGREYVL